MALIISFSAILFTSSIIFLISTISISRVQCITAPAPAPTPPSPNYSILQTACNDTSLIDLNVCLQVLQSTPEVVSAKGLRNISIAIIEAGISNSTNTHEYIKATFNRTDARQPQVKGAFNDCQLAYEQVVERFSYALREVMAYDYDIPSYELLTASTDCIELCDNALAEQNVKDEVISRGNQFLPIFGLPAVSIVNQLYSQVTVAPPPSA